MAFPKIFNLVWVGSRMPKRFLHTLHHLAAYTKKNNIELNLWVDNPINYHKTAAKNDITIPNLKIHNVNDLYQNMKLDSAGNERYNEFMTTIINERNGLKNEAAAVDLIRLEILRQKGGYYFDLDTDFRFDIDKPFVTADAAEGILFPATVAANPFRVMMSTTDETIPKEFLNFNNDIIAALPNHPAISEAIEAIVQKSIELAGDLEKQAKKRNGDFEDRMSITLEVSGPTIMRDVIEKYAKQRHLNIEDLVFKAPVDADSKYDHHIYQIAEGLVAKSNFEGNWIKTKFSLRIVDDIDSVDYKPNRWIVSRELNHDGEMKLYYPDKVTHQYQEVIKEQIDDLKQMEGSVIDIMKEDCELPDNITYENKDIIKEWIEDTVAIDLMERLDLGKKQFSSFDTQFPFFKSNQPKAKDKHMQPDGKMESDSKNNLK